MPAPERRPAQPRSIANAPLPTDLQAEQGIVSAIKYRPAAWDRLSGLLTPDDFFDPACAAIWKAYQDLAEQSIPIDEASIRGRLVDMGAWNEHFNLPGIDVLGDLLRNGHVIERSEVGAARRLVDYRRLRKFIDKLHFLIARAYFEKDDIPGFIVAAIDDISELTREAIGTSDSVSAVEGIQSVMNVLAAAEKSARTGGVLRPVSGLCALDHLLGGFKPAKTYVIAARPGVGKSALAMQIGRSLARTTLTKRAVAVFNLEMPAEELTLRNLCSMAEVDAKKMLDGIGDFRDWDKLTAAATGYQHYPLFIVDKCFYIEPLISHAKEMAARISRESKGAVELGMVIVDYIQLLQSRINKHNETAESVLTRCSRALKLLSLHLNVPVIVVSQLKRPETKGGKHKLQLQDLRGSGSIEQDADAVVFITRDEMELRDKTPTDKRGLAEIDVAKHRGGAMGSAFYKFVDRYTYFKEWEGPLPFEPRDDR